MFCLSYQRDYNPICTGGGQICSPSSHFDIASKLKRSFALMHPNFKSNLITHIFRKFGVSQTSGSDIIFAFVRHLLSFMQFETQRMFVSVRILFVVLRIHYQC